MAATINDIVRESGVSIATVSKYLNGRKVKDSTAAKIDEAVKKLNYIPNDIARSLVTSKSKTVGVLLPSIDNEFCSQIVQAFIRELRKSGYAALLCDCDSVMKNEVEMARFLLEKKVDSIFSLPLNDETELADFCRGHDIPVIFVDHIVKNQPSDIVITDNKPAVMEAALTLIELGHRRIAMIGSRNLTSMIERTDGYFSALYTSSRSVLLDKELFRDGRGTFDGGYNMMKELLSKKPTAVICSNYNMTLGALYCLLEAGIRIGDDISFVGFDSFSLTNMVYPPISVIKQNYSQIGIAAAKLLLRRMSGDYSDYPKIERIPAEFHQTASIHRIEDIN